jgi:hypothetical protein
MSKGNKNRWRTFVEQMMRCTKEYYSLDMRIQRQMSLE